MPLIETHTGPLRGIWKIEETSGELLERLAHKDLYLPHLGTLRTEHRKQEWLAARVLLKELTGEERPIAYRADGAPYWPDTSLYLSISHTRGYAAVAVQETPAAGIDIEYYSDRVLKIRHRFLSPAENAAIDPSYETEHLLVHWCAKEALFKMIGRQGVDFIAHLHICPFAYRPSGQIEVYETHHSQPVFYRLAYQVTRDFVLVWSDAE